jgi:hypothetical protein
LLVIVIKNTAGTPCIRIDEDRYGNAEKVPMIIIKNYYKNGVIDIVRGGLFEYERRLGENDPNDGGNNPSRCVCI